MPKKSKKEEVIPQHPLIVPNLYDKPPTFRQKGGVINHPARIIALGPSGSGKTNLAAYLLTEHFAPDTITIFASNLEQDLFKKFIQYMTRKVDEAGGDLEDYLHVSNTIDRTPEDYDTSLQHLVLFDDMIAQKSKTGEVVAEFFKKGRPRNISVIATTQGLFNANPQVRENTNYLFAFPVKRAQDRAFIYSTYCQAHLTRPQFDEIYAKATNARVKGDRNNFFSVIDTDEAKPLGLMFRRGLLPYTLYPEGFNEKGEDEEEEEYHPPSIGGTSYHKLWKGDTNEYRSTHGPLFKYPFFIEEEEEEYIPKKSRSKANRRQRF